MAKISDIIEEFILSLFQDEIGVDLSRNDLAVHFGCAPSQINYVLATRFTIDKGFMIESHRGGGGYIRIVRMNDDKREYLCTLLSSLDGGLSAGRATQIAVKLVTDGILSKEEAAIVSVAVSDKAIKSVTQNEDMIRANIFKEILSHLLTRQDD